MKSLLAEYAAVCIVVSQIFGIASEEIGIILQIYFSTEWKSNNNSECKRRETEFSLERKEKKLDLKTMDLRTREKKIYQQIKDDKKHIECKRKLIFSAFVFFLSLARSLGAQIKL